MKVRPHTKNRPHWIWLTSTLTLGFLSFWLYQNRAQWTTLTATITKLPRLYLVAAFGVVSLQLLFQSLRLWSLLPASKSKLRYAAIKSVFTLQSYGQLLNAFLPARAGDALKVVRLKEHRLTLGASVGTLIADKAVDMLAFVLLCLPCLPFWIKLLPPHRWSPSLNHLLWLGLGIAAAVLLIAFIPNLGQKAGVLLKPLQSGLRGLGKLSTLTLSLLFSTGSWIAEAVCLAFISSGIGHQLGITDLLWVLAVLNLGIAIPITLANLGAFEGSIIFALGMLSIGQGDGLAIAILHHAMQMSAVMFWSLCLWVIARLRKS